MGTHSLTSPSTQLWLLGLAGDGLCYMVLKRRALSWYLVSQSRERPLVPGLRNGSVGSASAQGSRKC